MGRLKLKPWPFNKDEEVELYWICSPYLNNDQNWICKVAFRRSNNTIKEIELPWGTLPNLVIGQIYMNGYQYDSNDIKGKIEEINVSGLNNYEFCNGFDMPYDLYYLYKNSIYGKQRLCKFILNNRIFYIPCVEVIRSFLTPYRTLTYQLLKPQGMGALIESISYPYDYTVRINLSRDFPKKLANDDNIMHLLWILTDKYAKITWDYVYKNLYIKADNMAYNNLDDALSRGIPIEARPPYMEKSKWVYRGITVNNNTLIFEIKSILGLQIPYNFIYYNHPDFHKPQKINEPRLSKRIRKKEDIDYEIDESQQSTYRDSNVSTVDSTKLKFGFDGFHVLKKYNQNTSLHRTGKHEGNNIIESVNINENNIVGTQDWAYNGGIKPIEFESLEVEYTTSTMGLEEFIKAIKYIDTSYSELNIHLNIILLPEGKNFSYYPSGHRRTCAIAKLERKDQLPRYILEVGRADNWSISTLLIYPLSILPIENKEGQLIDKIINGLINNNGHWDRDSMYDIVEYKFDIMKHVTNQSIGRWAERIANKALLNI